MSIVDKLNAASSSTLLSLRHIVRRGYLRRGVKHYGDFRRALSAEQRKAAKEYWGKYTKHFSPLWHELYTAKTGKFDVRYIPDDIMFTEIEEYLNDWSSSHDIDNKCNYGMYFPEVKQAKTLFRRMRGIFHDADYSIISYEQALKNCRDEGDLIVKYAVESGRGGGVYFWKRSDGEDKLRRIIEGIKGDAIAQAIIVQHPLLAAFHEQSVNCVRVMTLATPSGVEFVCAYLRMGQGGHRIDYLGGCSCGVNRDGTLMATGFDNMNCKPQKTHNCGISFEGYRIPGFEAIVRCALKMHEKLGDFRIASWDFSVSADEEPIFIEVNLKYGGVKYHQLCQGPLFGSRTDEILNEAYGRGK